MINSVVIIDDDESKIDLVERSLSNHFNVYSYSDTIGATAFCKKIEPDLILLDLQMPTINGERLLPILKRSLPNTNFVLYSNEDEIKLRRIAFENKISYLTKDIVGDDLAYRLLKILVRK